MKKMVLASAGILLFVLEVAILYGMYFTRHRGDGPVDWYGFIPPATFFIVVTFVAYGLLRAAKSIKTRSR